MDLGVGRREDVRKRGLRPFLRIDHGDCCRRFGAPEGTVNFRFVFPSPERQGDEVLGKQHCQQVQQDHAFPPPDFDCCPLNVHRYNTFDRESFEPDQNPLLEVLPALRGNSGGPKFGKKETQSIHLIAASGRQLQNNGLWPPS